MAARKIQSNQSKSGCLWCPSKNSCYLVRFPASVQYKTENVIEIGNMGENPTVKRPERGAFLLSGKERRNMAAETSFDYYYGDESNQFSFYRIPRQLVTGDRFKRLSTDAKLLYGLLLDRMSLSAKNGWYDEQGRVYIYYTLDEIQEDLNCGHDKATRMLVELDNGKNGFGLIERVRQGQGRPTKIYVKRFTTRAVPTPPPELSPRPRLFSGQDCGEVAAKTAEKPQSRVRGSRSQDCGKVAPNYIKSNQTDFSYTDPSILPSGSPPGMAGMGWMDRLEQRREVDEAIGYESLCSQFNREDVNEIAELIVDVLCTTRPTLRIGGEELPIAQVKDRFYKLDSGHLEYVFDCLRNNTTQIRNIRAYLLTALYNAPTTINNYYQAAVQHDFGP